MLTSRLDLPETHLHNPDLMLFTYGSYLKADQGQYWDRYATVSLHEIIEGGPLPLVMAAQQAELMTLTQACIIAKDQTGNI